MSLKRAGDAVPDLAALKRAHHRKYEWCRLRNDFTDLPVWRAVARRCKIPVHQVVAIALRLEGLANKSVPRGNVADMSVPEFAAALDLRPNVVARVRAAFEEPDISWIDQDFLVGFYERNPDEEDPTAAERQRRRRAKLKLAAQLAGARAPPYPPSRDVTRDSVTVTARSDHILAKGLVEEELDAIEREGAGGAVHSGSGESGDESPPAIEPVLWLVVEGKRIVAQRCAMYPPRAQLEIERWQKELRDDALLADILHNVDLLGKTGGAFMDVVRQEIGRRRHEAKGPPLPLMPPRKDRRHA